MKLEFSEIELRAIVKVLTFVRFECKEYEARFLAGSPYVAEVYKRITEATSEYYKSKGIAFSDEWPSIESINGYLDVIKIRIKDTENWNDLLSDQRELFLRTLVYPYKISDIAFTELVRFGNEIHAK